MSRPHYTLVVDRRSLEMIGGGDTVGHRRSSRGEVAVTVGHASQKPVDRVPEFALGCRPKTTT